ncbi:MAG: FecR family protein [candidate division Zixibacteria bacterium]|nr:FecR family protein [candidate division Zixibacteria bacterium]
MMISMAKGKRKREKGWKVSFLKAFLPFTLYLLPSSLVFADALAESQARLGEVTGSVQVLTQGAPDWIDAHVDLPLETGDQIRVGEEGQAEVSMAQNVLVVLDAGTHVIMGHTTTREGKLSMSRGALLGKIQTKEGAEGVWRFETPMGICAVRGTEFAIVHSEEEGTHLGVFDGAVEMAPAETAAGTADAVMIRAREEGVLEKKKPFRKLNAYSPVVQRHIPHVKGLRNRYARVSGVWVPLTGEYRKELRRKHVAPVKVKKTPPRRQAPRRRPPPH